MNRSKIKLDLTNYISNEPNTNFRGFESKISEIISKLYSSKHDSSLMTGWLNLPHDNAMFSEVNTFVSKTLNEDKYDHLLVLGIGGSSLGAQALLESLRTPLWNRLGRGKRKNFLTIDFIDNLDPQVIRILLSRLNLKRTLFVIISKTGTTVETIVPMLIAKEWIEELEDPKLDFYKQCIFITSKEKGLLYELSKKHAVPVFSIPENVGGRYSVFSPVGLLPLAFSGVDLSEIQLGIQAADLICQSVNLKENPASMLALSAYFSYKNSKNIFALMPYSTSLKRFADWFIQLWAESIGKEQKGSTPVSAIGATDQHSQIQMFNEGPNDKLICFVKINKHKRDIVIPDYSSECPDFGVYNRHKVGEILNIELDATRRALSENKRPNILITMPELDEYYISQLMYIFEVATAINGMLLEVNPFNQPGVELAKKYTKEALVN